jgi:hypothetical protein
MEFTCVLLGTNLIRLSFVSAYLSSVVVFSNWKVEDGCCAERTIPLKIIGIAL